MNGLISIFRGILMAIFVVLMIGSEFFAIVVGLYYGTSFWSVLGWVIVAEIALRFFWFITIPLLGILEGFLNIAKKG